MTEKQQAEKMLELYNQIEDENMITNYFNKEKEKEKEEIKQKLNDEFNKITYIKYEIPNFNSYFEVDFLFDYSKVLGPEKEDSKITQWQVMNKDRLFPYGIHGVDLMARINKSQPKGANNKLDSIISNLNYRLQRHGRLAPTKDIARRLDKKSDDQIPLDEEEGENDAELDQDEDINTNEENINNNNNGVNNMNNVNNKPVAQVQENYYDTNDPFIDDNLDELSEGEDNKLLYKIKKRPGNYTENEIMTGLRKYLRPKKNFKRIKTKIHTSQTDENNNNIENMDKAQLDHSDNYVDITEYTRNNIKIPESEVQKSTEIINYINSSNRQSAADRETMIENILGQTMLQKKTKREVSNSNNSNGINEQEVEVEKKN